MGPEITTDQARHILALRRRWPGAEVRAHQRPWGVIIEIRREGRTVSLTALDGDGSVQGDRALPFAA